LGMINKNCEHGIYGKLNDEMLDKFPSREYAIAMRNQIKEGAASILANIDGKKVEEYSIEIQKVNRQVLTGSKGMIIKITDQRLLNETGGIVQGMSGSPIIQNDRIVGAVTHVLVNDPTKGYGVFIESMIKNINCNNVVDLPKAG
jgi:stage IV sporulation protein B